MMRVLTEFERNTIVALAEEAGSDKERDKLLLDIQNCTVGDMVSDGSMLKFHIAGYERPPFRGQDTFRGKDRFPVEASITDADDTI
jgi:hypothetical protein